jgi:endo-1,4-beta-xylanase
MRTRSASLLARPSLLVLALALAACGSGDEAESAADDITSGASEGRFVRPIVVREHPLSLANPNSDAVTRPVWGGAFALDHATGFRASLDGKRGGGGLVFGGRGDPEHADTDRSVAIALVAEAQEGKWALRELAGSATVQEVAIDAPRVSDFVVELAQGGRAIKVKTNGRTYSLSTRAELVRSAGTYVTLAPGAELGITDLAATQPLASGLALGTPLRELARARGMSIGTATDVWPPLHDAHFEALLAEQFDTVAPTEFYWPTTRGEDKDYFFLPADLMVNFATVHRQKVNGYFLTWDFELPQWVQDIGASGDAAALGRTLDDHVRTLVGRYKGRMNGWVVANEAIWGPDENNGGPSKYGNSIWTDVLGPEYIERVFKVAHEVDPSAQLLYNETGAEAVGPKSDFMYAMAKELVRKGVPINGIGLQFHLDSKKLPKMEDVRANLERIAGLGLDVYITELDVSLEGRTEPLEEKQRLQAKVYSDVLGICLGIPRCRAYTVFGFGDRYAWDELGDASPLMFDKEYKAKPAFFAVQSGLARR